MQPFVRRGGGIIDRGTRLLGNRTISRDEMAKYERFDSCGLSHFAGLGKLLGRALAGPVGSRFVLGGLKLERPDRHAIDSFLVGGFSGGDMLHAGRCGHWHHRNKRSRG